MKRHAGLVIAALRKAQMQVHVEPERGVQELASLLLKISDRCAEGRFGALLDDAQLVGLDPVRDYEPLRMAAVAVLTTSGVATAKLFGVPDALMVYAAGLSAILSLLLVYGRNARRGLDILDSLRGIQRP
ncbi:hypothetical protein [Streptomyces durhamensis]|uniref:hypothetical protein n=1 Tax=Streptomyces durhamensis TaxID=68194 RepID=UPI0012FF314F|nr:hypothetical protein [Streptomyces durhamensis]